MLNTVTEEDQVHWWIVSVVKFEHLVESWDKHVDVAKLKISLDVMLLEVAEKNILELVELPLHVEVSLHDVVGEH
jgi:hypothetical protein